MFQDYNVQDADLHEAGEAIFDQKNAGNTAMWNAAGVATYQSELLLKMLRARASVADVRAWLTEGDNAPFRLAPGATSGGSLGAYTPKPK